MQTWVSSLMNINKIWKGSFKTFRSKSNRARTALASGPLGFSMQIMILFPLLVKNTNLKPDILDPAKDTLEVELGKVALVVTQE